MSDAIISIGEKLFHTLTTKIEIFSSLIAVCLYVNHLSSENTNFVSVISDPGLFLLLRCNHIFLLDINTNFIFLNIRLRFYLTDYLVSIFILIKWFICLIPPKKYFFHGLSFGKNYVSYFSISVCL